jgi:hypothetical protein
MIQFMSLEAVWNGTSCSAARGKEENWSSENVDEIGARELSYWPCWTNLGRLASSLFLSHAIDGRRNDKADLQIS